MVLVKKYMSSRKFSRLLRIPVVIVLILYDTKLTLSSLGYFGTKIRYVNVKPMDICDTLICVLIFGEELPMLCVPIKALFTSSSRGKNDWKKNLDNTQSFPFRTAAMEIEPYIQSLHTTEANGTVASLYFYITFTYCSDLY